MLLTWCCIPQNRRAAVTNDLLPGGLEDLKDYSIKDIKDAIKGFKSLAEANDRFNLSAHATKGMVQLSLWVKDRMRLVQPVTFENGTTINKFTTEIEQA
jgi:hypothetical protein